MRIQLTDYGVSVIKSTGKPLKIKRFQLGSEFGYVPSLTAKGIKGSLVYQNNIANTETVSANVVKYEIALDYRIGTFYFGELALYDASGCVAVASSDSLIHKLQYTNESKGNSILISCYLSMVDSNYVMWIESIGQEIGFEIPVCKSFDQLPPVASTDPNFWVVKPVSSAASATIAYTDKSGLWCFDCYQFTNSAKFEIIGYTSTSVIFDVSGLSANDKQQLKPSYYGEKLIEFCTGNLYSICRTVSSVKIIGNECTIIFKTPLADVPSIGDSIMYFARNALSLSNIILPIATSDTLGGIKLGDGLIGEADGTVSVDFPVLSVNDQIGDVKLKAKDIIDMPKVGITGNYSDLLGKPEPYVLPAASHTKLGGVIPNTKFSIDSNGNLGLTENYAIKVNGISANTNGEITIPVGETPVGLVNPQQILDNSASDFNTYTQPGLFYGQSSLEIKNCPYQSKLAFTLEVVPIQSQSNACIQRFSTDGQIYFRLNFVSWLDWISVFRLASTTNAGNVIVGNGLSITNNGVLNAMVQSFNTRTGAIELNSTDVINALKNDKKLNSANGIPSLDNDARLQFLQAVSGSFICLGIWNPETNHINDDANTSLSYNGTATINVDGTYKTVSGNGLCVVSESASQQSEIGEVGENNLVFAYNGGWHSFGATGDFISYPLETDETGEKTRADGFIAYDGEEIVALTFSANSPISITNGDGGDNPVISLNKSGVKAGTYNNVTVNDFGLITAGQKTEALPAGTQKGQLLYWNGNAWVALPLGTAGQVLTINDAGEIAWSNKVGKLDVG